MPTFERPIKQSIARNLTLHLGTFGALIFCVTLVGSMVIDVLGSPNQLRNAVTLKMLGSAVRPAAADAFSLEDTPEIATLKKQSPNLWFVVSDGRVLIEHNAASRPVIPVDIRIDGPSLSATFSAGNRSISIQTIEIPRFDGRIVLAATGARPDLVHIVS